MKKVEKIEKIEKIEKPDKRVGNGGTRSGAGRKKGGRNQLTLERIAAKERFVANVAKVVDELFGLQMNAARKGDGRAIDSLLDRAFGKADQSLDLTSKGKQLPTPILGGLSVQPDDRNKKDSTA